MYKEITSMEELQQFLDQDGKKLLFKHSTTCPVSAKAHQEFVSYLEEAEATPAALVKVIETRPVSNAIADQFEIKHESPQIFLFNGKAVLWHASHHRIRKDAIAEHVNG